MYGKNKQYRRLITSYRWQKLRAMYLSRHAVCEICESKGLTSLAEDVHHRVPVESAKSCEGMRLLAYDINNLQALCKRCHEAEHRRLGSGSLKGRRYAQEAAKMQAENFINKWCGDAAKKV